MTSDAPYIRPAAEFQAQVQEVSTEEARRIREEQEMVNRINNYPAPGTSQGA